MPEYGVPPIFTVRRSRDISKRSKCGLIEILVDQDERNDKKSSSQDPIDIQMRVDSFKQAMSHFDETA